MPVSHTARLDPYRNRWIAVVYILDMEVLCVTRSTALAAQNLIPGTCYGYGENEGLATKAANDTALWFRNHCLYYKSILEMNDGN